MSETYSCNSPFACECGIFCLSVSRSCIEFFNLENLEESIKQRNPVRAFIYCLDYTHYSGVGEVAAAARRTALTAAKVKLYDRRVFGWLRFRYTCTGTGVAQSVLWLDYGLDNRGVAVRFTAGESDFFVTSAQTGSGTHPDSYLMSPRNSFPVVKAAGAWSWPMTSI
jgi:hypothetical protein